MYIDLENWVGGPIINLQEAVENFVFPDEIKTKWLSYISAEKYEKQC